MSDLIQCFKDTLAEIVDVYGEIKDMNTSKIETIVRNVSPDSKKTHSTLRKVLNLKKSILLLEDSITKHKVTLLVEKPSEDPIETPVSDKIVQIEKKLATTEKLPEPATKAKSDTLKPSAKAKSDTLKPTTEAKSDTLKPSAKAKSDTLKPTTEAKSDTLKPTTEAKSDTLKHTTKVKSPEKPDPETGPESAPLHKQRKSIPKAIKSQVWAMFVGNDMPMAKCLCCKNEKIDIRNFQCGHVLAEANGGTLNITNLRPICQPCNTSMGTMSMEEYSQKFYGRGV